MLNVEVGLGLLSVLAAQMWTRIAAASKDLSGEGSWAGDVMNADVTKQVRRLLF